MEYEIIIMKPTGFLGNNIDDLPGKFANEVSHQIALGWEPLGGVAIGWGACLFQTMIKRR